ncbi:unnamed protein product [Eruca vesicaria subsp. sativa]|uniref:Uncharacterized protein n=1 Tax=Eruca vesicaria subsp. sativa TaxID=29727 RepID=A0ABC8JXL7_ERUVS|nr:unnamed protein product [Eruca vesicaria subsp. sativa]
MDVAEVTDTAGGTSDTVLQEPGLSFIIYAETVLHAIIVLQMSGEFTIPSQYVLKLRTRDARSREALESYLIGGDYSKSDSDVSQNSSRHEEHNNNNNSFNVADTRQESLYEVWKETALQEQRNLYSILDDYLSTQKNSHEMGKINTMASNRNGYCTAHQNIHSLEQSITQQRHYGTEQLSFRPEVMYERLQDMGNLVAKASMFPSGIKSLADYVHSKGLKFAIYFDAGDKSKRNIPKDEQSSDELRKIYILIFV